MTARADTPGSGEPLVVMSNITKRFAGAVALENVSVDLRVGEIHSVIGANGAGKSTLGKVLAGVHRHDGGSITVNGRQVEFDSPGAALGHGIAIMQQEIALAGKMSVVDNVFLGTELGGGPLVARGKQLTKFSQLCERTGFTLEPQAIVDTLRLGEQQQVAVLWALARGARLVVMDEPTASLDRGDSLRLLDTARMLSAEGITVVFVSHFLDEVLAISDRITVLANGTHIFTREAAELDEHTLVEAMIGGTLDAAFPSLPEAPDSAAPYVFEAQDVRVEGEEETISLGVRAGEIVGLYGLVGSGRSEFAHAISGSTRIAGGQLSVDGSEVRLGRPGQAITAGITLLPESRKDQGLMLGRTVLENTALSALGRFTNRFGIVRRKQLRESVGTVLEPMSLRGGNRLDEEVGNFSGGNQQKVLLAKCLLTKPKLLILDEPTRGVDIGAKRAIYDVIVEVAAQGTSILLISSEEAEVLHLCHRIAVFRKGSIAQILSHGEADENRLLAAALGAGEN
ncbi:MAG: sugar ABC transporter ATP-binding protein [Actinobacteria bacterium]|nr:sugar ABC transporter ATP-binding protein [Actinomycetota bacterium]